MAPVLLQGAPDGDSGVSGGEAKASQVMQLDMSNDVLEELLASARSGKQPQIMFGRNLVLRTGSRSYVLESRPSKLRQELYRTANGISDSWDFVGLLSHSLSIKKAEAASAGMDTALQNLKNNMAALEQEREARKTLITSDLSASKPGTHLAPHSQAAFMGRSSPKVNDDMLSRKFPAVKPLVQDEKAEAIRSSLVHLLALRPLSLGECSSKLRARPNDLLPVLKKLAEKDPQDNYLLTSKGYKELRPWEWRYTGSDRHLAIDNAIRAYDRLRIDTKDSIWQNLLPENERNKGTILSKLKLQPVKVPTPGLKPKIFDKKTGLSKRPEQKKNEKAANPKVKEKSSAKTSSKAIGAEESRIPDPLFDEIESKRDSTKDKHSKLSKQAGSPAQRAVKESKPSTVIKSLLNKPRNPSPLSKSPPVNASDFEDNHPVHKTLSAAVSPSKSSGPKIIKRKAQAVNGDGHRTIAKKPRLEEAFTITKARMGSTTAVKPPSTTKRRSTDESSSSSLDNTPLKIRKLTNGEAASRARSTLPTTNKISARPRSTTQVSDDSSVTSPDLALSHRDRLDLAEKFKRSYARYEKLYREVSAHKQSANSPRREELLKLHNSLAKIKKQISGGIVH